MRLIAFAAGIGLATIAAAAPKPGPAPVAPAIHDVGLGALRLTALRDSVYNAPNDGKTFAVDVGPAALSRLLAARRLPTDNVVLGIDALLVRGVPGHLVLIDTGIGPRAGGVLAQSLARAGVRPEDVTDVLITHSHGDHVGGLVGSDGRPAFPRAAVRMAEAEWAWMQGQPDSQPLAKMIAGQVRTFTPGAEIVPHIASVAFCGHTPGHVGYRITSGKDDLIDVGDTVHSALVSLAHPEWAMGFDSDQALARTTREAELARLARQRTLIFTPHFPFPGFGRVVAQSKGYAWQPNP